MTPTRQLYRGYIIECRDDEIKVLSNFDREDVFPFEDFFSTREAQDAIDPVADHNDNVVNIILDLFPERRYQNNVFPIGG